MASSSTNPVSSESSHISLSSTLSLPRSCQKHVASKIENLVEYSYIPESAQINESQFPVMSPYHLYKQKTSFTRSIRTLISTKRLLPKEYIQFSRVDQCALQASQSEQYVTLEIPTELVTNWKREGYTHLHLGGVRLILTLHGRKGLPVTSRIALLDTRFKQYQHAVIGTVLTTLHAGSVNHKSPDPAPRSRPNSHFKNSRSSSPNSDNLQIPKLQGFLILQEEKLPIHGFSSEGYPVYPNKVNGHFLWDVPEAHMCNPDCPCLDDSYDDEDFEIIKRRRRKQKTPSHSNNPCKSYSLEPPDDPSSSQPLPIYKKALKWIEKENKMSPITSSGQPEVPKQYAAALNWQTQNANAQNQALHNLRRKIDKVTTQVTKTKTKMDSLSAQLDQIYLNFQNIISELDVDLRTMINNRIWGPEFNKKEAEIGKFKAELARINADKEQPSLFTKTQSIPIPAPLFDTYQLFYNPSKPPMDYNKFFGLSYFLYRNQEPSTMPSTSKKPATKIKIS
ncbi:hypothetical protein KPL71_011996 [Citrus sinensis]|uniref:Uncharacterized protein n=1 Tax=Citrus sinensis TaxID=2711 RepID=A0ACB8L852_CITSI|nr:hypothetical protein KPL71_011996 [Citrus sinensis]